MTLEVTLLNGALPGQPEVDRVADTLEQVAVGDALTVKRFDLQGMKVGFCLGCFQCWTTTPGVCRIDDGGRVVAEAAISSDWLVFLTPVTFRGYSSVLKKAVDRLIPLVLPFFRWIDGEVHHQPRYRGYPNLLGLGLLPEPAPDSEESFRRLVKRNAINLQCERHFTRILYPTCDQQGACAEIGDGFQTGEEGLA